MNREDDRREAARSDKNVQDQGRDRHVRERVHTAVTSMSRSSSHEQSSGTGIDRKMDRIASEQEVHTRDGKDGETVRSTIERHRQEMRLSSIAGAIASRNQASKNLGSPEAPGFKGRLSKLQKATADDPTGAGRGNGARRAVTIDPNRDGQAKARTAANHGHRVRVAPRTDPAAIFVQPPRKSHDFHTRAEGPIKLLPPNTSQIRIGGTVGAAAPQRFGELITPPERNRLLERNQPVKPRENALAR